MLRSWPILFIVVPLVELYFIIKVGEIIGAFWTIVLVLLTAFIGINLLRYQGLSMLARAQQSMSQGVLPAREMLEGMVLAVGGVLLITPGFITDTLGFLCLIPATRQVIIRAIMSRVNVPAQGRYYSSNYDDDTVHRQHSGDAEFIQGHHTKEAHEKSSSDPKTKTGRVIEGECRRED